MRGGQEAMWLVDELGGKGEAVGVGRCWGQVEDLDIYPK